MNTQLLQPSARVRAKSATTWYLAAILTGLSCLPMLAGADVRASLDRKQFYAGDALTLVIEATDQKQNAEPDLSPLQQDFDILGTSRSSQISIINGHGSSSLQWQISLTPKHIGELTIPAIQVGNERTQALTLRVDEVPQGALGEPGDEVFLELDIDRPNGVATDEPVMVQQQLPLVVRLYSALPLRGGTLSEPAVDGAVLERLGADQRYGATRNGREYDVIERRYSLSPEHSGELRIPPVVFEGELTPGRSRSVTTTTQRSRMDRMFQDFPFASNFASDPFSMFEPGQRVRAQSQAVNLTVAARPEDFTGTHWLPAQALEIQDSWAEQPPTLSVGEPATRTLTFTAKGLAGNQIPDVDMHLPDSVRAYRDPTQNETRTDGQAVYAVSQQAMTLIPTQTGSLDLPELRVRWWDISAKREREALIPAIRIPITAGTGTGTGTGTAATTAPEPQAKPPVAAAQPDQQKATVQAPNAIAEPTAQPTSQPKVEAPTPAEAAADSHPSLVLGALLGLLVLVAAAVWAMMAVSRKRSGSAVIKNHGISKAASPAGPRLAPLREQVRLAAEQNDPKRTAESLLALARAVWPDDPPLNLTMLARRFTEPSTTDQTTSENAKVAITELEHALYARSAQGWTGTDFWHRVTKAFGPAVAESTESDAELPPLYPDRR